MRRQARARGRRCLMPRTASTAQARKAAERTAASKSAKTAATKAPAQTGTATSKDVMQTAVQTEPAAEEIAEMVGMDGLDAEAEAAALVGAATPTMAEVDLDDQTSTMGDSVHTYLKSIGRTSLLTAEEEV